MRQFMTYKRNVGTNKQLRKVLGTVLVIVVFVMLCACANSEETETTGVYQLSNDALVTNDYVLEKYHFSIPSTWTGINNNSEEYAFTNNTDSVYMTTVKINPPSSVTDEHYANSFIQGIESTGSIENLSVVEYEDYYQKGFSKGALCKCTGSIDNQKHDIWIFLLQDDGNTVSVFEILMPEGSDKEGLEELYSVMDTYVLR